MAIPEVLLRCQEMYFELCPRERLRFYADENMRKHRPVGPKTFGMLESSLRNPQDKDGIVALELKDGEHALDAPKHLFKVYGRDRDRRGDPDQLANSLCMTFAPEDGLARVRDMAALVRRIAEIFPYRSGCAGFGYQVSRYSSEVGESFAWQKSMRHPQMDIVRSLQDRHAVANNAGKTVNWLTLVCDELLRELGSPKNVEQTLEAPIEWTHLGAGVLFQLGASPGFIDRTRGETAPDYHRLHRLLRPLIERAREQSPWFATGSSDDQAERTDDWFRRFDRA
ncbi:MULTISPECIES: type VI immunity family protein [Myxococcus]|uniref:type VI immunity family protein n=1 Tax=Myxococcus TaxID=32 RepID=UPI001CED0448|nr:MULTISPECIES: type VI immunity family protein [Myxococcus]UYI13437.1 DUF3396 domain-containing protein [Myxococcus xanthus]UYI20804.1 DUF3396 domain-containing protein [Myxococcus xanthus]